MRLEIKPVTYPPRGRELEAKRLSRETGFYGLDFCFLWALLNFFFLNN